MAVKSRAITFFDLIENAMTILRRGTIAPGVEFWGPAAWKLMHAITFTCSETPDKDEQTALTHWFHSLSLLLPCNLCREHYAHYMEEHGDEFAVAITSGRALQRFAYDLHESVNARTGATFRPSFEEVVHMYTYGFYPTSMSAPTTLKEFADPHFGMKDAEEKKKLDYNDYGQYIALVLSVAVILREVARLFFSRNKKRNGP
jgi:hypothetical protein